MTGQRKPTRDLLEIIHRRFYEGRPERLRELEEARASAAIARRIYALREKAGMSRQRLARLVGTSTAVIRRLEEDDYDGQSLEMLKKIAHALDQRVDIRLLPVRSKRKPA
jgi:ribosome-binding protein aMBF1 (putative translation factor)